MAVVVIALDGCGGDTTGTTDQEPTAGIIRLSVGNQQITIDQTGQYTGGSILLRAGVPATVTSDFLTVGGDVEPRVTPATYQLNVVPVDASPIVFQRSTTDPFAGTMSCNFPNITGKVRVSLYNVEKQHDTWGPFEVQVVVSN